MTVLESNVDVQNLPLRALVACAARCARRVQPLFKIDPRHPEARDCQAAIETAIRVAEAFAAGSTIDLGLVSEVEDAVVHALRIVADHHAGNHAAAYAANAAYAVVNATTAAIESLRAEDPEPAAQRVLESSLIATDAAISADARVDRAARLDLEILSHLDLGIFPALGEAVNLSEKGSLGPLFDVQPGTSDNREDVVSTPATRRTVLRRVTEHDNTAVKKENEDAVDPLKDEAVIPDAETAGNPNGSSRPVSRKTSQRVKKFVSKLKDEQNDLNTKTAELKLQREKLEAARATLQAQREQLLAERLAFEREQAEAANSEATQRQLREVGERLDESQRLLDDREQQIEARSLELDGLRDRLRADQQHTAGAKDAPDNRADPPAVESEIQSNNRPPEQTAAEIAPPAADQIESARQHLEQQRAGIEQAFQRIGQMQEKPSHAAAVEPNGKGKDSTTARDPARSERSALDQERRALEEKRDQVLHDQQRLREASAALKHQNDQLELRQRELEQLVESLSDPAAGKSDDPAGATAAAVKGPSSVEPQGGPGRDAADKTDSHARELQKALERLQFERQQIQAERHRLAELVTLMGASRKRRTHRHAQPSDVGPFDHCAPETIQPLRLLAAVGTASAVQIGRMLHEISILEERLGGNGLRFSVRRCRVWSSVDQDLAPQDQGVVGQRCLVEVLATPDRPIDGKKPPVDGATWDRFAASLLMSLRLDAGLVDYFAVGEHAGLDHPSVQLIDDAIERLRHSYARGVGDKVHKADRGIAVDLVNRQIQRIQELRAELEWDCHLTIELAPAEDADDQQRSVSAKKLQRTKQAGVKKRAASKGKQSAAAAEEQPVEESSDHAQTGNDAVTSKGGIMSRLGAPLKRMLKRRPKDPS